VVSVVCAILLKRTEQAKERANFEISCLEVPDAVASAIIGFARCRALSIQEQ